MKRCSKCGERKTARDFYKNPRASDGLRTDCKACVLRARKERYEVDGAELRRRVRDYRTRNPEKVRESRRAAYETEPGRRRSRDAYLKRAYGIGLDDFDALFAGQGERCAVCRTDDPGKCWSVDHDHVTGAVRGILCWHCNVGLGHFRDDIANLVAAADYLTKSTATVERVI